jgi:hypothetical protein
LSQDTWELLPIPLPPRFTPLGKRRPDPSVRRTIDPCEFTCLTRIEILTVEYEPCQPRLYPEKSHMPKSTRAPVSDRTGIYVNVTLIVSAFCTMSW